MHFLTSLLELTLTHKRLNFIIISTIEIDLRQWFNSHFQSLLIFIDTGK